MLQELTIAIRTLWKRPAYALSVIATLALGIGATALMFSLMDAALFRGLPFPEPDGLAFLTGVAGPQRSPRGGAFPEVGDWRLMNTTFADVSLYDETSLNLRIGDNALRVQTEMVNASYFGMLGVQAALGRTFTPDEDAVPDRDAVAVISHALWRERFGTDPDILKRQIHLNDRPFTIVGVMPERFAGISFDTDLWVPSMMVSLTSAPSIVHSRSSRWLGAIGRLKSGVTLERAQEDMNRVASILEARYPDTNRERGVDVQRLRDGLLGSTRTLVVSLFAAVTLFLFVACANVASLQLARATSRSRELAVRVALGARQYHVIRQLLTESLVLAAAAGTLGVIAAAWSLDILVSRLPAGALPRYVQPQLDWRAVLFAAGASVMVGALVTLLPAFSVTRRDLGSGVKHGVRTAGPGLGSIRRLSPQRLLVMGQVALAMTLLSAAGLMVRSIDRQMNVDVAFEPADVLAARMTLPANRYAADARVQFADRLIERLHEIPGVSDAAIATSLPFTGNSTASILTVDGQTDADAAQRYFRNFVTPEFFAALRIQVVRGRAFTHQDAAGAPPVAVINESAARRLWPGAEAVGRRIRLGNATGPAVEIVGVVADARFRDLTTDLTAARVEPDVYFPFAQRSDRDIEIAIRARDGSSLSVESLQQALAAVDASLPLYQVQPLETALQQQTSTGRFGSALLMVFSFGALLLSAIGLYGLISYAVGLSRREIAIRMALGASGRRVIALVTGNGMALVCAGILLGGVGGVLAGRALESQLFQTSAYDVRILTSVSLLMLTASAAAILFPTRRAVRVDPQAALRAD